MEEPLRHRWTSLYLLLLSLGSLTLFIYGFCPLKYTTGRLASWNDLPESVNNISIDGRALYGSKNVSVVLMIVDALRLDFLSEATMPFTTELVKNRTACHYVSIVDVPTVTMPRVKSMMTGTGSAFADLVLNMGARAVNGDNVVRAAAAYGRRNFMYGDYTWTSLFPKLWNDTDPTKTTNIMDSSEVDNNVTRHLDKALQGYERKDPLFDFMVLHYAGLDHIGHAEGALSVKILPKLKEMDQIVRKIFNAMKSWDREGALIVCGDHGMRTDGSHGGGSAQEVQVPLVLARTLPPVEQPFECPYEGMPAPTVAQTDMAPSIAYLLRVPIPADSTGRALPAVLPQEPTQHLYLLHYNARQNARALTSALGELIAHEKECYKLFRRAEDQFALFLSTGQKSAARLARQYYEQSLDEMAKYLTTPSIAFNTFAMRLGIFVLFFMLAALCMVTLHSLQREERIISSFTDNFCKRSITIVTLMFLAFFLSLTMACAVRDTTSDICQLSTYWTPIVAAAVASVTYAIFIVKSCVRKILNKDMFSELNFADYLLIVGSAIHSLTFMGTSFIEEEHYTWYYLWNTLMMCVLVRVRGTLVGHVQSLAGAVAEEDKKSLKMIAHKRSPKLLLCWLLLIVLHRLLRDMNHTGSHWSCIPDIRDWLIMFENAIYKHILTFSGMLLTFIICLWNLQHTNNKFKINTTMTITSIACIVCNYIATNWPTLHVSIATWDTVQIVNIFWGLLAVQFVFESLSFLKLHRQLCFYRFNIRDKIANACWRSKTTGAIKHGRKEERTGLSHNFESLVEEQDMNLKLARSLSHVVLNSGILTATLLLRPHNVILVPSLYATCVLTAKCVRHTLPPATNNTQRHLALDVFTQTLAHYWIGSVFFFYQGNSNRIVSMDVLSGYVGVNEYRLLPVALRIAFHTYAAPSLAAITLFCSLSYKRTWTKYKHAVWVSMNTQALLRVYSLTVYTCVASWHKGHLFVFTVFSPKLLYDLAATVFSAVVLLTVAAIFSIVQMMHCLRRTQGD